MSSERIWLLVNKRRAARGREPVTLTRVQRAIRLLFGVPPKPPRSPAWGRSVPAPLRRWDFAAPQGGRPAFKSDNRR